MLITTIHGGFGNQLFMYACGYALSRKKGAKLMLDISYLRTQTLRNYELGGLRVKCDRIFDTKSLHFYALKVMARKLTHALFRLTHTYCKERTTYVFDHSLMAAAKKDTFLYGYWQTEKYFNDYREEILPMLEPNYVLSEDCANLIQRMREDAQSVAVHVRRGDYVGLGICLEKDYYEQAVAHMLKQMPDARFFVFSDDRHYAQELFKGLGVDFEMVSYHAVNPTLDDFFVMKACRHDIIANSSYSWWAAWANDTPQKVVVCPHQDHPNDFYPSSWVRI